MSEEKKKTFGRRVKMNEEISSYCYYFHTYNSGICETTNNEEVKPMETKHKGHLTC